MKIKTWLFAACIATLPGLSQATTVTLTEGADWTKFRFDKNEDMVPGNGGAWLNPADGTAVTFVFTVVGSALLQVTDSWRSGDIFEVFANGSLLGATSAATTGFVNGNSTTPTDYSAAFADPNFSSGSWLLQAGDYEVTGRISVQPENYGSGAIRFVSTPPVPVPASLSLMMGAGAVFGMAAARRRSRAKGEAS